MTKKNNVLALPPMKSDYNTAVNTGDASHAGGYVIQKREKEIIDLSAEQSTVMKHTTALAQQGITLVGSIQQHGSQVFDETSAFIIDVKQQPNRDAEHQSYIDQFSERQIQMLAQQVLGIMEVGAVGIGMEVHRSLYPEYPKRDQQPDEKKGFFKRVFG